jgi:transposase-like protein
VIDRPSTGGHDGKGREVWAERVRRLQDSELTTAEFAAELGVNPRTLTYWKWRLRKEARTAPSQGMSPKRTATFVEVKRAPVAPEPIEVLIDGRTVVRVREGFDLETLRRVVVALSNGTAEA